MDQILFSIVIPVYNVEPYLEDALRDIQKQTYTNWEAIIVNDASPDKSVEIASKFVAQDSRFKIVSHTSNKGLSAARNTGLKEAQGVYVWFPDPDDRYSPQLLKQVNKSLDQNKAPILLIGHEEVYFSHSNHKQYTLQFSAPSGIYNQKELRRIVIQLEEKTQYGYAWNKLYRRDYLLENNLYFKENLPLIEDIAFNVEAFQNLESLNIIGNPLYYYAKREGGNLTNKFVPEYFSMHYQRINLLYNQQKSWELLDKSTQRILGTLFSRYILSALERNCDKRSNMKHRDRVVWCKNLFSDSLFSLLLPSARGSNKILNLCIKAVNSHNTTICLMLGRLIHIIKQGSLHDVFIRVKSSR